MRLCEKFWGQHGRREAGEGAGVVAAGEVRAGLEGLWRRMEGLQRQERMYERWREFTRDTREIA